MAPVSTPPDEERPDTKTGRRELPDGVGSAVNKLRYLMGGIIGYNTRN
jgi:hypothetical protein